MKAEIIAVGTELLLGQIANTNAQYISRKLAETGIDVYYHTVVGDNAERLKGVVEAAQNRSDLIIFSGGLGPTKDDLTKETIASCIGKKLVEDKPAMDLIEAHFRTRGIPMTENNRRQAQVIEGSFILPNDHGMAPGMAVESGGIVYILLPGPPRELCPMVDQYAIPYLQSRTGDHRVVHSRVLRFFGIGESALEDRLMDLIDNQSNPTIAPLAGDGEVTIRLTAKAQTVAEAERLIGEVEGEIQGRVGEFIYGYDDDSLPTAAFRGLKERSWKLSLAESCTGGLVSRLITSLPGSSAVYNGGVVSYSPEAKIEVVGVPAAVIDQHGTVSAETALSMAAQVKKQMNAEVGVSITGVAGPDPSEGKPVGLVYVGLSTPAGDRFYELKLAGSREAIQVRAAKYALFYLIQALSK